MKRRGFLQWFVGAPAAAAAAPAIASAMKALDVAPAPLERVYAGGHSTIRFRVSPYEHEKG
jgi:hypothetical protein